MTPAGSVPSEPEAAGGAKSALTPPASAATSQPSEAANRPEAEPAPALFKGASKPEAEPTAPGGTAPLASEAMGNTKADAAAPAPLASEAAGPGKAAEATPAASTVGGAAEKSKATTDKPDPVTAAKAEPGEKAPSDAPTTAAAAPASQGRATRVLRKANPVRVVRSTARSTSAWAKRPTGRLVVPAVIALLLLGAAGTAGAYLVPQALQSVPSPSATPGFGLDAGASGVPPVPSLSGVPPLLGSSSAPVIGGALPTDPTVNQPVGGVGGARPADALASWAQQAGTRAGIPVVAVQAYGYAEFVVSKTSPNCHLNWTTIAAIAKVESGHGSANNAVLNVDGSVTPPIFGLPLDGKGGRQTIADTDQGTLDSDTQFDRAMGPLQFIPSTWREISANNAVDADNNGVSDPNDIDDASLAAAKYLCAGGRDLSKADAWWDAILSYNAVRPYAQKVFDAANDYGQRSRV